MMAKHRNYICAQTLALVLTASIAGLCGASEPAAQADGPYVTVTPDGALIASWIAVQDSSLRIRSQRVKVGEGIAVSAVGANPSFQVRLRKPSLISADTIGAKSETPVFIVADTHGEYEILVELLRKQRIVDATLRWSFGRGHLVILGDVFDRGPNQIEILWLIYKLEAEAAKAGGGVHLVLGNHEAIVMTGDLRYINPKYDRTAQVFGAASYSELVGPRTLLGQWLRTKPAVLKIGDMLCVHGGVSPEVVERNFTLRQLNAAVRDKLSGTVLSATDEMRAKFAMGQLGPLWYRGYFADQKTFPTATSRDIDRIRKHFEVTTILVGHTTVPTVTSLYDGRVIAVQVYPHRDEKTGQPIMEALRVENGRFLRAKIDGTLEPLDIKSPARADTADDNVTAPVSPIAPNPRRPD